MSGELPPSINIEEPRWDQSTFVGRAKHFFTVTDPRNILLTDRQLEHAGKIMRDYRQGIIPPGLTENELWRAKYIYDSAFHPDTGEKMILIGRMSAQVPMNMTITGCMMTFYRTTPAVLFWQWVNQSFNAVVNYTNRSGDAPLTVNELGTAYVSATTGAVATALGLNALTKPPPEAVRGQGAQAAPLKTGSSLPMTPRLRDSKPLPISRAELSKYLSGRTVPVRPGPRYKNTTRKQVLKESAPGLSFYTDRTLFSRRTKHSHQEHSENEITLLQFSLVQHVSPLIGRFVPFAAVAAANCINIPLMRQRELKVGIPVTDGDGSRLGESARAARQAIAQVVVSRILMAAPGMAIPPFIMNALEKKAFLKRFPWMSAPIQVGLVGFCLVFATPLCCALFPQKSSMSVTSLEAELQAKIRETHPDLRRVYFNKGL